MTADSDSHRDIQALRDLVGEQVFARGQACHDGGNVSLISVEPVCAAAHVRGVHVYYTELSRRGAEVTGKCGCAAGIRRAVCEHVVAVALAVDASMQDKSASVNNVVSMLARQGRKAPLAASNSEPREAGARNREGSAVRARKGDDEVIEAELRKAIDEAVAVDGVYDRRNVERWAKNVLAVFDSIRPMASTRRAPLALRLIDHAIERIEQATKIIIDPDNRCGDLFDRAATIYRNAAKKVRPDPVQLARTLFEREHLLRGRAFRNVLKSYCELMGEAGLAEYRRLAEATWRDLPSIGPNNKADRPPIYYYGLLETLDHFAKLDGDVEKRIALRTKDLSTAWDYTQLINLCRSNGLHDLAIQWADQGLHAFADKPNVYFVRDGAKLLVERDRKAEAEGWLRAALDKVQIEARRSPGDIRDLCKDLCALGGAPARQFVISIFERQIARGPFKLQTVWADTFLRFLVDEEMFEEAFLAGLRFKASWHVKRDVARLLEPAHLPKAIHLYVDVIWQLLGEAGSSREYSFAWTLIERLGVLHEESQHLDFLDQIKERFASKSSFMTQIGFHEASYRAGTFKPVFPLT